MAIRWDGQGTMTMSLQSEPADVAAAGATAGANHMTIPYHRAVTGTAARAATGATFGASTSRIKRSSAAV